MNGVTDSAMQNRLVHTYEAIARQEQQKMLALPQLRCYRRVGMFIGGADLALEI
jgi:hypothetical protein